MRHLELALLKELIRHGEIMERAYRSLPHPLLVLYLSSNRISHELASKAIALIPELRQLIENAETTRTKATTNQHISTELCEQATRVCNDVKDALAKLAQANNDSAKLRMEISQQRTTR